MHKKTAPYFVHYGEPEKIEKSFAFNVDIFSSIEKSRKVLTLMADLCIIIFVAVGIKDKYQCRGVAQLG